MAGDEWGDEPPDIIGEAESSQEEVDDRLGDYAEVEPWPWGRVGRGLAVATVVFAAAAVARVAVSLWAIWQRLESQPGMPRGSTRWCSLGWTPLGWSFCWCSPQRRPSPPRVSRGGRNEPIAVAAVGALIMLGCAAAEVLTAWYAITQRRLEPVQPSTSP
ncbi:MAG: hypothetical protein ACRDN9_03870 [Streptosporangiaceae bacterium]